MTVDIRGGDDPRGLRPDRAWRSAWSLVDTSTPEGRVREPLGARQTDASRATAGRVGPLLGTGPGYSGVAAFLVSGGPALVPPAPRAPWRRQLDGWIERALVFLFRASAWRYARSSRVSVVPGRNWSGRHEQVEHEEVEPAPDHPRDLGAWRGDDRAGPVVVERRQAGAGTGAIATATARSADQPAFPIDVVYTWVDDRDPAWQARYQDELSTWPREGLNPEAVSPARFHDRDELRYSLRSLAEYAPFVRNVYLVTAGQVPSWLDPDTPNLRVVPHEEILDADCLPTFNSHAIESALHRIDGLSEHYLYLNDDFFFARPSHASTFFTADGRPKLFPDQRAMVPDGPCSPADRAVDSASKNTRDIVWEDFGYAVKYKMQHVPYAQRRSVIDEMEERLPWVFKQTAHNPFRHYTDVNIPSCLSHYYALLTGAAVTGRVQSTYINIGNPWATLTMRRLLQNGDRDVFCLNDGPMGDKRRSVVDAKVGAFLETYFPTPSPYERAH